MGLLTRSGNLVTASGTNLVTWDGLSLCDCCGTLCERCEAGGGVGDFSVTVSGVTAVGVGCLADAINTTFEFSGGAECSAVENECVGSPCSFGCVQLCPDLGVQEFQTTVFSDSDLLEFRVRVNSCFPAIGLKHMVWEIRTPTIDCASGVYVLDPVTNDVPTYFDISMSTATIDFAG